LLSEINAPALLNDCNRHAGAMLFFLKWRKCRDAARRVPGGAKLNPQTLPAASLHIRGQKKYITTKKNAISLCYLLDFLYLCKLKRKTYKIET
jgi:hypothetical protein